MSLSQYLLGAAELAVIAASLGLGAYRVRALLVSGWTGAIARLAEIVLGISALIVVAELVGVFGLLEEGVLVPACVLMGLGGAWWAGGRAVDGGDEVPAPFPGWAMLAIAVGASALIVAQWAGPTQESLNTGMYYQDTTWYHMSFSGRFAQEGSVGPLHFTDPLKLAAWFYPQNSELLHAVGMVALDSDFLSPLVNLVWLALSLLAAWCIGRPYAAGAATLLGAGVVLDSDMIVSSQAGNAPNDIAGLFFLLAVIAFLVNGAAAVDARETGSGRSFSSELNAKLAGVGAGPLFMAGLAAGLGLGTKITLLAAMGALTIAIVILAGRRGWLRAAGIYIGAMVITSGFWYGRNLVEALTPFPQIEQFGPIDLPGPQQGGFYPREPHKLSEYYNDPDIWREYFFPVLHDRLGPLWPVILASVGIGLAAVIWKAQNNLIRVLAIVGVVAGFTYVFTPLTASGALGSPTGFDANLRYVSPPIILAFVLIPLIPALRRGRWPLAVAGAFGLLLLQGAITSPSWDHGHGAGSALLVAVIVGVPVAMALMYWRGTSVTAMVALPVLALIVLVAVGRPQEQDYLRDRYATALAPPLEGGFRSTADWKPLQQWGKEASGQRIGVVGRGAAFGQYVFYGDDLSNHVQYIGLERRRGTFLQIPNCVEWRRAVNQGNYGYVVTTPRIRESETKPPPENQWTAKDPASEVIVRSGPARIYKLNGPLSIAGCARLKEGKQ
ncbi:MAG: hypothetical protein EXQ70_08630 [Solirubrobacterales bacterium]|nr:hypothetical protein [Solirubrobacterales bacterium]